MYHVNPVSGEIGTCHAKSPESCPFGVVNHNESLDEIQIRADKINKLNKDIEKKEKAMNTIKSMFEFNETIQKPFHKDTRHVSVSEPVLDKNKIGELTEYALQGKYVSLVNDNEVKLITKNILRALDKEEKYNDLDIIKKINEYGKCKVTHIGTNTLNKDRIITYVIESENKDEDDIPNFTEKSGKDYLALCYCFNIDNNLNSEFGDCFFRKKRDGYYYRVG